MTAIITAWTLGALLAVIGVAQLAGPRFLKNQYELWDYPQGARLVTGFFDMVAAVMILVPGARGWGLALAAILIFGSVVTLLNHRQYVYGAAVILMMAALVPATLAVPHDKSARFIASETQLVAVSHFDPVDD